MQPLPRWVNASRALKVITKHLYDRGETLKAQAILKGSKVGVPVTLPGYNLFSRDEATKAFAWCIPGSTVDRDEVIGIWEEYVDRGFGVYGMPDRIPRRAVRRIPGSNNFFGAPREALQWWLPAAQLIALASHKSGVSATYTQTSVALDMGDYKMEVTPGGCWSNTIGHRTTTVYLADDADIHQLDVPGITTGHPLAQAVGDGVPPSILWALSSVIQAEGLGRIPKVRPVHLVHEVRVPRERQKRKNPHRPCDIRAADAALRAEMDHGSPLQTLFEVAVPVLMTKSEFSITVGSPRMTPDRVLGAPKVQRVLDYLNKRGVGD